MNDDWRPTSAFAKGTKNYSLTTDRRERRKPAVVGAFTERGVWVMYDFATHLTSNIQKVDRLIARGGRPPREKKRGTSTRRPNVFLDPTVEWTILA